MKTLFLVLLASTALRAEIVRQETFANGLASLTWQSAWGEEADQLVVDWMDGNPSGDGFVGKLGNANSGGGVGTLVVDDPGLSDYTVSAQVYLTPGVTHYRGIVGRATNVVTDSTSLWGFYAFVADLSTNTGMGDERLMLRKWVPGGQAMTNIHVWSHADLGALYPSTQGWYNLAMRFEGSEITCSINGTELPAGTYTDTQFTAGGFGTYFFDFADMTSFLFFDDVLVDADVNDVTAPARPQGLSLGAPWPNPFNPAVNVELTLEHPALVNARVYDVAGRLVRNLAAGPMGAGSHRLVWDGLSDEGRPAASGVYLLRVEDGRQGREARMTLLR
jgi:hypothetical protein